MIDHLMPDIPRFHTALAEWLACVIFILPLRKRFNKIQTMAVMAVALVVQSIFLILTDDLAIFWWIPCMITAVVLMVLFLYGCLSVGLTDIAYYGMIAFVAAEFMASFEWQVTCFVSRNEMPQIWLQALMLTLIYGGTSVLLYMLFHAHLPQDGKMNISQKEYFSGLLIAAAVFAVSNLSYITVNTPFSGRYSFDIANIRTIVDLGGIAILYAHLTQCCEMRVRKELEAVQNVLQNQYVQYKQSRESIDLINYKYHDLKHQIAVLRSEEDPGKRAAFLDRMENEIRQYEAQNKTGNTVLDTVLTTKSLYCSKHGITFTCVADGTLLEFMDTMDICSIFGNALDNAIECEIKIPDKEKRLIHVSVSRQKNFLIIIFENYYENELKYQEGNPVTTKKEKAYHGYGLKSIRYTVNKYDGAVNIDARDNWFQLKILIPMETAK